MLWIGKNKKSSMIHQMLCIVKFHILTRSMHWQLPCFEMIHTSYSRLTPVSGFVKFYVLIRSTHWGVPCVGRLFSSTSSMCLIKSPLFTILHATVTLCYVPHSNHFQISHRIEYTVSIATCLQISTPHVRLCFFFRRTLWKHNITKQKYI